MPDPVDLPDTERSRLQALREYRVLDTPPEAGFDDLTDLAARVFAMPIATVSLIDHDRQWFKSRIGLDLAQAPRDIAFCDTTIRGTEVLVVDDARLDARFAGNPLVTAAPGLRFYAGAPLLTPGGWAVGTLCVMDHVPRRFDAAQRAALAVLSRQVVAQLELRKQHAALATSETRMALVLEGANDGWWDWDLGSDTCYCSPRGWTMLGYGDAEVPFDGHFWKRVIHPDDLPRVNRSVGAAIRGTDTHYALEMRLLHKDGHAVPVLSRGHILRDACGTALRLSGTNTDLSERKAAEQALRAEQQLNRQIVESSPVGICIFDRDGRCLTVNEAMARCIGTDIATAKAQNLHHIASWKLSGLYPLALRTLATGEPGARVVHATSSFGRDLYLAATFSALDAGGERRLMLTVNDLSEIRHAEQERLDVQHNYEMLFANSMDGVLQTRPDGSISAANPAACAMLGYSAEQILLCSRDALLDLGDPRLPPLLEERRRNGRARGELRMRRADGSMFEVEISSALYNGREGQALASVVFRDITDRRTWARRLEESLDLLDQLAQHVPGVLYQYRQYPDGRSNFPFASQGIWDIYEVTPEEVYADASPVFQRLHPDDAAAVAAAIAESAQTLQPWHQEYRVILPRQGARWRQGDAVPERLADGSVLWHGFISDISERKRAEDDTHRLAYYDALTGLPNRRLLLDRIAQALAAAQRSGQVGALLFIDLDNFKQINDARGHSVGDQLLMQVAQRLSRLLRSDDSVARLGGDEFVVLACGLGADIEAGARHAMAVADKVRELLDSPYEIDGALYGSSGSIGITLFPKGGERVDDLLREADTAMYRAKAAGRNRIAFFASAMQAEVEERLALEQDLKEGIAAGQLAVHVQPQVDAAGREVGAELLLRWNHPRRGSVSPAQFIPVAEESGLILALGDFVIHQACLALAQLQAAGQLLPLSVNVSPRQFRKDDFVQGVLAALAATGAPAHGLVLEVTEGLLVEHWEDTLARMSELVERGIRFSIDDFGTGYSSLAYLKKMPLYELKIDRSFVRDTPQDPNDTAIVEAILSVARHLKLRVVAEGVETRAQADFLVASGCDCLQGYLFARPMPMVQWLALRLAAPLASAA